MRRLGTSRCHLALPRHPRRVQQWQQAAVNSGLSSAPPPSASFHSLSTLLPCPQLPGPPCPLSRLSAPLASSHTTASPGTNLLLPSSFPPAGFLLCPILNFGPSRDPEDQEYEISLGKIIDVLRDDYGKLFDRSPCFNFDIYDESVVLEIGDPVRMKPLKGINAYRQGLELLRAVVSRIVVDGKVECRVHDKTAPPTWALKVACVCSGKIDLGLGSIDFQISANSLYDLVRQPSAREEAAAAAAGRPAMSHKIHRHRIEFTEILPGELKRRLSGILPVQDRELAVAFAAMTVMPCA